MSNNFLQSYTDNDLLVIYQVADKLCDLIHLHQNEMCVSDDFRTATSVYDLASCLIQEISRRDNKCDYVQHFDPS